MPTWLTESLQNYPYRQVVAQLELEYAEAPEIQPHAPNFSHSPLTAPNEATSSTKPPPPKVYFTSWRELLLALDLKNTAEMQNKVRSLNKSHDGPIVLPRKGSQPKVERSVLLEWWNGLQDRFEVIRGRESDAAATTQNQHAHGKSGIVVPDIGGSIKKRRSDKVTKPREGPKTS